MSIQHGKTRSGSGAEKNRKTCMDLRKEVENGKV